MNKTTEALKLAEEALEELHYSSGTVKAVTLYKHALAAIREALAEPLGTHEQRTAEQFLEQAQNHFAKRQAEPVKQELNWGASKFMPHEQPVKQEPVAWALMHKNGLELNSGYGVRETLQEAEDMQRRHLGNLQIVPLYTTPPTAAKAARQIRDAAVKVCRDEQFAVYETADRISEAIADLPVPEVQWSDLDLQCHALQQIGAHWYDGKVRNQWIADTCHEMCKVIAKFKEKQL